MKSLILKEVNRISVILIFMFGIYIILHGHLSPGGGFAGGTVLSAGMILYKLVDPENSRRYFSFEIIQKIMATALTVYGSAKGYHILHSLLVEGHETVSKQMTYSILEGGTLVLLNACVGLIVAGTFYVLVSLFMEGEMK